MAKQLERKRRKEQEEEENEKAIGRKAQMGQLKEGILLRHVPGIAQGHSRGNLFPSILLFKLKVIIITI